MTKIAEKKVISVIPVPIKSWGGDRSEAEERVDRVAMALQIDRRGNQ